MDWSILFMGPVGAGKTQAVQTLSEIAVVDTDVAATDSTAIIKDTTTVSMDAGVLDLGEGDRIHLIGAPGQDRFDFMWDILLEQAKAVALLIDHRRDSRLSDLDHYLDNIGERLRGRHLPLAIGATHMDMRHTVPLSIYKDHLSDHMPDFVSGVPAVMGVDARDADDVRAMVVSLAAMVEMHERHVRH
ncbi:GTP-binding protein [Hydrogenophaga sp. 5NK40-0174]|uniref:GTP-binding protein n=1 Tax=Hydrogenophaga sp. 5NK40-0174 TaxID=3127649 RepID=UPI00310A8258